MARKTGTSRQYIASLRKQYSIPAKVFKKKPEPLTKGLIARYRKAFICGKLMVEIAKELHCSKPALRKKYQPHITRQDREKRAVNIFRKKRKMWIKRIETHINSSKNRKELAAKIGGNYAYFCVITGNLGLRSVVTQLFKKKKSTSKF